MPTPPNTSGASPEPSKVTSGQPPTGASPASGSSTSGQPALAEDQKALRQKITSQAEEIKRLRAATDRISQDPVIMDYLKTGKRPGEPASAPTPEQELDDLVKKHWEDGSGPESLIAVLKKAAEMGEQRATERVRKEMEPYLRRQISSTFDAKLRSFFGPEGKDLPEMATSESDFVRFLATEVREKPWLRSLVDDDIDAAFDVAWSRFTKQNGDPAAEKARQRDMERRSAASLEDSTGLTPGMSGIVTQGGDKSLAEIFKELESRGI